jgi:hypothetical protein
VRRRRGEKLRKEPGLILILVLSSCIGGCLAGSEERVPETVHDPGYRFRHGAEAQADLFFCQLCHGEDFKGTPQVPSCFVCHPSGPPFVFHPPPLEPSLPWRFPVNHGSEGKKDLKACKGCHGRLGGRGTNPAFDIPLGLIEKGCESVEGCHLNGPFHNGHNPGTAHPSLDPNDPSKQDIFHWYGESITYVNGSEEEQEYFISHYNAGNLDGACPLCHGAKLKGGAGPACTDCHIIDPVANPTECVSCHGTPPGPTEDLIDEVGREDELEGNPVYQTFTQEVAKGYHLQHETIPCQERDSTEACRTCHGSTSNADKHHVLVGSTIPEGTDAPFGKPGDEYECLTCHEVVYNPITQDFEIRVVRDCNACHSDPFPAVLPCPE